MPVWLANFLGGWVTKQFDRLVKYIWTRVESWWAGKTHKDEVDKYVDAINALTAKAKAEVELHGKVSVPTEVALAKMLERRNRNVPFNDDWVQDNTGN